MFSSSVLSASRAFVGYQGKTSPAFLRASECEEIGLLKKPSVMRSLTD